MWIVRGLIAIFLVSVNTIAFAAPPVFSVVKPNVPLVFPTDFGAHPEYRTEWWYATGWLETPDKKPLGFQITFFRSATEYDRNNPSTFAPSQLIIGHAALSDPAIGKLQHDQRSARAGFGLAYAKTGDTDVKIDDWQMQRNADGSYRAQIMARDFTLQLSLTPSAPPMLQGDGGFSRKGPLAVEASYYYSQPQLKVSGTVTRNGARVAVAGTAWLDHEWSTSVLDGDATGWDWLGANLDDGGALMAFQVRRKGGGILWSHAALRNHAGKITQFTQEQVHFAPNRQWRSPRTGATYPVATTITTIATDTTRWTLIPLQDDQELDSRQSTGSVYWEGGVTILRNDQPAGHGYLELTGYLKPLKL